MPAKTVPDHEIIRAILTVQGGGQRVTLRRLAPLVGMSAVGVSRRLHHLADRGAVELEPEIRLLPLAVDVCAERGWSWQTVIWSVTDGELRMSDAALPS